MISPLAFFLSVYINIIPLDKCFIMGYTTQLSMQEREQETNQSPETVGIPLLEQAAQALKENGEYKGTLDGNGLSRAMTRAAKSLMADYDDVEATPLIRGIIKNNRADVVGTILVREPVNAIVELEIELGNNRINPGKIQLLQEPEVNIHPGNLISTGKILKDNTSGKIKEKLKDPQELFSNFLDEELEKRGAGLEELSMKFQDDLLLIELKGESIYAEVSAEDVEEELVIESAEQPEPVLTELETAVTRLFNRIISPIAYDQSLVYLAKDAFMDFVNKPENGILLQQDLAVFSNELGHEFKKVGVLPLATECYQVAFDSEDSYKVVKALYAYNFIETLDEFVAFYGEDQMSDIESAWVEAKAHPFIEAMSCMEYYLGVAKNREQTEEMVMAVRQLEQGLSIGQRLISRLEITKEN